MNNSNCPIVHLKRIRNGRIRYQIRCRSVIWVFCIIAILCPSRVHDPNGGGGISHHLTIENLLPQSTCFAYAAEQTKKHTDDNNEEATTKIRRPKKFTFAPTPPTTEKKLTLNQILYRAGKRGLGGGVPGAIAGVVQVLSLMWLRTIINYQCRYGTTFSLALQTLLQDGGIARLYHGVSFALVQAPLARFVSTAANDGIEALLSHLSWTKDWGPGRTTVVASIVVGLWRMMLMPIDTMKTVLQVDSTEGFRSLMRRVKAGKIGVLYSGAIANAISAIMGHYPWFYTYNVLASSGWVNAFFPSQLLRNAWIGVMSSIVSDTVVNAMRVIKTTKQSLASKHSATYTETVKVILAADGWRGLFGRGLRTRIFANALQSLVFTVIWRGLAERFFTGHKEDNKDNFSKTKRRKDNK